MIPLLLTLGPSQAMYQSAGITIEHVLSPRRSLHYWHHTAWLQGRHFLYKLKIMERLLYHSQTHHSSQQIQ